MITRNNYLNKINKNSDNNSEPLPWWVYFTIGLIMFIMVILYY